MHTDQTTEPFEPQSAGQVLRLTNDWQVLLETLPQLDAAAVVYRGNHFIHCIATAFPKLQEVDGRVLWSEGFRGYSANLQSWSEAWLYHECRQDQYFPCIEIANEKGQGLVKLCFRTPELSQRDRELISDLIVSDADKWDILHLYPSNRMDCASSFRHKAQPLFRKAMKAIQKEAFEKECELGIILKGKSHSSWDAVPSAVANPCGWCCFGGEGNFISVLPDAFHSAQVVDQGARAVAMFYDDHDAPALSIVEQEGIPLDSMRLFKEMLSLES